MPYVITVKTHPETSATLAAATLEEAREIAYPLVHAAHPGATIGNSDEQRAHRWDVVAVQQLPAEGGEVGPLHNGTTISVRYVTEVDLRDLVRELFAQRGPGYDRDDHLTLPIADIAAVYTEANA